MAFYVCVCVFFMMLLIINFIYFYKNSAKKGKDIREEDAEVRPDPDIDEDIPETARSG